MSEMTTANLVEENRGLSLRPPDQKALAEEEDTCGINIRGVPRSVWRRARQNALTSGLPFKVYLIRLLEKSEPLPAQPSRPVSA
jgi:hypothetical protein